VKAIYENPVKTVCPQLKISNFYLIFKLLHIEISGVYYKLLIYLPCSVSLLAKGPFTHMRLSAHVVPIAKAWAFHNPTRDEDKLVFDERR
jgi:hypothetical protein